MKPKALLCLFCTAVLLFTASLSAAASIGVDGNSGIFPEEPEPAEIFSKRTAEIVFVSPGCNVTDVMAYYDDHDPLTEETRIYDLEGGIAFPRDSMQTGFRMRFWGEKDPTLYRVVVLGDTDGKAGLSTADARNVLRCAVGLAHVQQGTDTYLAYDVNGDGSITTNDARIVLRLAIDLDDHTVFQSFFQ